ncbi:MAG: type VI secretion system protein TssA [Candidatus Oceanisphaera merdipullorum]|nr:type VI secretion system protein TssA [Candidatus Oceanisphaera merdipullorum]
MTTANALLEPIKGGDICGQDCRYEDEFDAIEQEIGKLNNIYHRAEPDWPLVAAQAQALLSSKTKDIRVAAWLMRAWLAVDGCAGLAQGCALLSELCSAFWSGIYPRKNRARIAVFQGLFGVLDTQLDDTFLERQSVAELEQLSSALAQLEQTLSGLQAEASEGLSPLVRRCQQQVSRLAQRAAPANPTADSAHALHSQPHSQQPSAGAHAQSPAAAANQARPSSIEDMALSAVANERDAAKLLRQLQDAARLLGSFWQRDNPADARRFRLPRVLTWAAINALPGANAQGQTQLKPVPLTKLHQYQDRLQQGDFAALLDELEISLTKAPFWLDGHHMSWQCLTGLQWQAAADEVAQQTRRFSGAFPSLLALSFDDGTPFASAATQDWLAAQAARQAATPATTAPVPLDTVDASQWQVALDEAFEQLSRLGLSGALQPLQVGAQHAPSEREAVTWRLAMARLCLQDKNFAAASALLNPIFQQFEQQRLWQWDPQLGRELCRLLLTGLDKLPQKNDRPALRQQVFERLCGLDASLALEF